jgi:hypothetical protein
MAVVVDVHPDKPYTPRVKRMVGANMTLESDAIDLSIDGAPAGRDHRWCAGDRHGAGIRVAHQGAIIGPSA